MTKTQWRVHGIVCDLAKIEPSALAPDANLKIEFGVDSLLALQIVAAIENEFGIEIPEHMIDLHLTVRSIAATVDQLGGR